MEKSRKKSIRTLQQNRPGVRHLLFLLFILCLVAVPKNLNAQTNVNSYLSNVYIGVAKFEENGDYLSYFQKNLAEYTVLVPSTASTLDLKAELSEEAPESSEITVNYIWRFNKTTRTPYSEKLDWIALHPIKVLVSIDEGCSFTIDAGVENQIQTYYFYVQKEDTPAANLTIQLNALPEVSSLTVSDKDAVTSAKEAYDALTEEQKSYMQPSLIQKLTDVEAKIAELEKAEADQKAADEVIDAIKAINPATATAEELKKVQEAYDALTEEQKALVDADATAAAGLKAIDAKVEELEKPAQDTTEEKAEETKPEDGKTEETKPAVTTVAVKKGSTFKVNGYKFKVTSNLKKNPTVTVLSYKNKKLTKIVVPAKVAYKKVSFKVTAIANNAFKGQKKAKSVTIGSNVKTIGSYAFAGDSKVKKITVKTKVLTKVGKKAFSGIHKKAVIKVPSKQLKKYKAMMKNKGQKKTVKIQK